MKKIDFHIHTVKAISDSMFEFDIDSLIKYVEQMEIDCIAITNHNLFDKEQFITICENLNIKVFPGIEIDLEGGHVLLISENEDIEDFDYKCNKVKDLIIGKNDTLSFEQFVEIFPILDKYLLIPHSDKNPPIKEETLTKFGIHYFVGEVTSLRKFKLYIKDESKPVPVIFSDFRFTENLTSFPTRQTFVNVEDVSLRAIKGSLYDKAKVSLSKEDGNDFFQATDSGVILSTGLNVIIGERSTGKTYTLDKICNNFDNVKYIKQFSLLQDNEEDFKRKVTTRHSLVSESYLKEFKEVVQDANQVNLKENEVKVEKFIDSLKKYASESDKLDAFSKCKLFNETNFEIDDLDNLKKLITSTSNLLENTEYKSVINKHVSDDVLKLLIVELIKTYNEKNESNLKKLWLNEIIGNVKDSLRFRSTTTAIEDVDFYKTQFEKLKINKFCEIVRKLQSERVIDSKEIRGFKIIAKTKKFTGAAQLKDISKSKLAFSSAFNNYNEPYKFIISLQDVGIAETEFYKYFAEIEYLILNKHGFAVSGGERSEFNLLHEINDALKHDLLLIDEPESSFDNIFLKNDVNTLIKDISKQIPVIVVTHNNTIGASIKPDYIAYTQKTIDNNEVIYKVFFGHPTSKNLHTSNGETIENLNILFNCLEAGESAYYERKTKAYEILKD